MAEARYLLDFLQAGTTQALNRAKGLKKGGLAVVAYAGQFIQQALRNFLQAQLRIVGVGKAVLFGGGMWLENNGDSRLGGLLSNGTFKCSCGGYSQATWRRKFMEICEEY